MKKVIQPLIEILRSITNFVTTDFCIVEGEDESY